MANNLTYLPLDNIGINGLNTQSNPTSLSPSWLVKADNIAFKESGRITFRNGFVQKVMPSTAAIGSLAEHKLADDTYKVFAGVGSKIHTVDLTDTAGAFDAGFTTGSSTDDWQFVSFNKQLFGFQDGSVPVNYNNTDWATLTLVGRTAVTPSGITDFDPSCGMGYYGRLWVGGITEEKDVVHYSDTLIPTVWYNDTSTASITSEVSYIIDSANEETTSITSDIGYKIKSFKELDTVIQGLKYEIITMCPEAAVIDFLSGTGSGTKMQVGDVYEADSTGALTAGCLVRRADWDNLGADLTVALDETFTASVTNADISDYGEVVPDWQVIGGPEIANVNDSFVATVTNADISKYGKVVPDYGLAGYIDLKGVWGTDEIVAIAPFYGKLVIFGKHNIVIYNKPDNPNDLELDEVIRGIGCVARDSVQQVADDLFFLSPTGLRSLARTTELDKVPLTDMSVPIKDNIIRDIRSSTPYSIKGVYVESEGLFVLSLIDIDTVYVFDMKQLTPAKTPRVTLWNFKRSSFNITSLLNSESQGFLVGQKGGSVAKYEGYSDKELISATPILVYDDQIEYTGKFQTTWIDLGEGVTSALLKKLKAVIGGGANTSMSVKWDRDFGVDSTNALSTQLNPPGNDSLYNVAKYSCNNDIDGFDYTTGDMCVYEDDGFTIQLYVDTDYVTSADEVATRNEGSHYYFCHPLASVPTNCESPASEYSGVKGLKEYNIPLSKSAKYVQFTFTAETGGSSTVLQDLTLLFKRGKIR